MPNTPPSPPPHPTLQTAPIYLVAAHPNWRDSRVNHLLLDAARNQSHVQVCDLYGRYPDYHIDVATEQAHLAAAKLVVLVHPIQWYSMPALQKLWLDEVLTYGWAYGEGGHALRGKDLWLVATTGGPEHSYHPGGYNRYFFDAFLPPYEQTAALCGMRFLPPLILHGAHTVRADTVKEHVATFSEHLASYPDWPELDDLETCPACDVPGQDRPHESDPGTANLGAWAAEGFAQVKEDSAQRAGDTEQNPQPPRLGGAA
jgi:glutathione-regulated potassium-efflux system ancillary protein KefF